MAAGRRVLCLRMEEMAAGGAVCGAASVNLAP